MANPSLRFNQIGIWLTTTHLNKYYRVIIFFGKWTKNLRNDPAITNNWVATIVTMQQKNELEVEPDESLNIEEMANSDQK